MIFRRKLHRRQDAVLPDGLRRDLVGGDPGVRVDALRGLWANAAQPGGWTQRVHRGRIRRPVPQPGDHVDVLGVRFQRLEDGRELEPGASRGRCPLVHDRAVRKADESEPLRRCAAGVAANAVAAGFIASRSGKAIVAPTPLRTARREMCLRDKYMSYLRQADLMAGRYRPRTDRQPEVAL